MISYNNNMIHLDNNLITMQIFSRQQVWAANRIVNEKFNSMQGESFWLMAQIRAGFTRGEPTNASHRLPSTAHSPNMRLHLLADWLAS